jgi:hypothetical protein
MYGSTAPFIVYRALQNVFASDAGLVAQLFADHGYIVVIYASFADRGYIHFLIKEYLTT